MRIKAYTAESVAEALKQVRHEMGAEAFLLKTRRFVNPLGVARVEVTACIGDDRAVQTKTEQKSSDGPNRIADKSQNEMTYRKNNSAPLSGVNLSDVHERLDAIEGMLAALISQMAQGCSN